MLSFTIANRSEGKNVVGVVACGDFNVKGELCTVVDPTPGGDTRVKISSNSEHDSMMSQLDAAVEGGWKDSYRELKPIDMGDVYSVDEVGITIDGERNSDCNPLELQRLDYVLYSGAMTVKRAEVLHNPWTSIGQEDFEEGGMFKEGKSTMVEGRPEGRGKCFSDHNGVVVEFKI